MSKTLEDQCVDLAWSQWAALGVSASGVLTAKHAVDLEAAICFAPLLADLDPRLHSEVLDWCIQFANDFVSVASLRQALKAFDDEHRQRFDVFARLVNTHGGSKWPVEKRERTESKPFRPSGKSRCRLDRAVSVQLRARKIFGINARADILVGLALLPDSPQPRWTHVNLLLDLGYTKRTLSAALNDLHAGGMLGTLALGNTVRYALRRREALRQCLDPLPATPGQAWSQRLAIAGSLISLKKQLDGKSEATQGVELRKLFERKHRLLERGQMPPPDLRLESPWTQVDAWIEPFLRP